MPAITPPLSPPAGTLAAIPAATIARFYVDPSTGSDTNRGTLPGNAFATIAAALAALGATPGAIFLLPGTHTAPTAGISIAARQSLIGSGMSTKIDGTGVVATYVVRCAGSRSKLADFWVTNVPAAATGVRVTSTGSTQNVRWDQLFVDNIGAAGIAYGVGDDTALDVSEVLLTGCCSVGNSSDSWHMKVGNGSTGNVLDNTNIGGNAPGHQYGVVINGGALESTGLNFEASLIADIWLKQNAVGNISFAKGRSETALRFLKDDFAAAYSTIEIADYTVTALQNTDGKAVISTGQLSRIRLKNVALIGATCPQYVDYNSLSADTSPVLYDFDSVASEHFYPYGGSPFARKGALAVVRNPLFIANTQGVVVGSRHQMARRHRRYQCRAAAAAFTIDTKLIDVAEINLHANAPTITLTPGSPGQEVDLIFVQDGAGAWTYTIPAGIALNGALANVSTARHRQILRLVWTGRDWSEVARVADLTPATIAANAITESFATGGGPYWLGAPSGGGPYEWEPVPGGGALGKSGGLGRVRCLAGVGDNDASLAGVVASAAANVIETGKNLTTVSATFVYRGGEGLMLHYIDDQNFIFAQLASATVISVRGITGGVTEWNPGNDAVPALTPGNTYTLACQLTATQVVTSLTGAGYAGYGPVNWTMSAGDQALYVDATKHGLLAGNLLTTFSAFSTT